MRLATHVDIPEIVRITNLAYEAEAFCIEGKRLNREEVLGFQAIGRFLVLPQQGDPTRLAGSVYLRRNGPARGYLGLLAVDPAFQGQGLGADLVAAVEEASRTEGARFLDLTVVSARAELFGFYGKLGFTPFGTQSFRAPEKQKVPFHLVKFTKALVPVTEL